MHYKIKVIIIGEAGVGKTSLVKKFISGHFSSDYRASIGTNMFIKEIEVHSNDKIDKISIHLWDIAGQERWIKMRNMYYKGSQAALIVGDLSRKRTFEQIEKFWFPDLTTHCGNIPIILIANKNDLNHEITQQELETLVKNLNASSVLYTSAKTGMNVEFAFNSISKLVIQL
ncbi:MAG: Rab family GTPase [Promethearchaeota archaeon]